MQLINSMFVAFDACAELNDVMKVVRNATAHGARPAGGPESSTGAYRLRHAPRRVVRRAQDVIGDAYFCISSGHTDPHDPTQATRMIKQATEMLQVLGLSGWLAGHPPLPSYWAAP